MLYQIHFDEYAKSKEIHNAYQATLYTWEHGSKKQRKRIGKKPEYPKDLFCVKYPTLHRFAEANLKAIANALKPFQYDCCCWVFQWLMEFMARLKSEYMMNAPDFFVEKLDDMTRLYFQNKEIQFWREFLDDQRDAAETKSRNMLTELVEHRGYLWNELTDMYCPHGPVANHSRRAIGLWTPREDFEQKLYILLNDGVQRYFKTREKSERMNKIHKEASPVKVASASQRR